MIYNKKIKKIMIKLKFLKNQIILKKYCNKEKKLKIEQIYQNNIEKKYEIEFLQL